MMNELTQDSQTVDLRQAPEVQREKPILLSGPDVGESERKYLLEAFDSGWIAPAGPFIDRFEAEIAKTTGRKHAVCVASGTAAMHLALLDAGVKAGDEVLCSSLTFIGSVAPLVHMGGVPVFIDSEIRSWNMDPQLLADELKDRASSGRLPAAVIAVDLYGHTADYDQIVAICEQYEVSLIEDAAEALGAHHGGRRGGSFGKSAIVSFNGNKIATASGGGAFLTDDDDSAARALYLATQAKQPFNHYEHIEVGFNYRLSNILAGLGLAQVEEIDSRISRRAGFHKAYTDLAGRCDGVEVLQPPDWGISNHWLTCALIDPAIAASDRDSVIAGLSSAGIESRPVWKPMHMQPVFADNPPARLNGTSERIFAEGICLPSGSSMSTQDFAEVLGALETLLS